MLCISVFTCLLTQHAALHAEAAVHKMCACNALQRPSVHQFLSFAQTLPSWPYAQVDSKKELEKLLRATCEAFIMAVTKLAVEPMLSFITKVTAVKVAASSAGRGKPLREQVSLLTSPGSQIGLLCVQNCWTSMLAATCPSSACMQSETGACLQGSWEYQLCGSLLLPPQPCAAQTSLGASPCEALEALASSWGAVYVLSGHRCGCRHLHLLPGLKRWWRK